MLPSCGFAVHSHWLLMLPSGGANIVIQVTMLFSTDKGVKFITDKVIYKNKTLKEYLMFG